MGCNLVLTYALENSENPLFSILLQEVVQTSEA